LHALLKKLPPSVTALLLQFTSFALVLLSVRIVGLQPTPLAFALLCGLLAATLSRLAGLARWWLPIQFLFAPALVSMLALHIPPEYFLAAFLILLAVYWSVFRTQVPLYLSSQKVWHALETKLPSPLRNPSPQSSPGEAPLLNPLPQAGEETNVKGSFNSCGRGSERERQFINPSGRGAGGEGKPNFRFIDLGSGLGGVLTHLARVRPDGHYSGVESAPLPFLWSWLRIKLGGYRNCKVHWGSIWDENLGVCDLAQYDVIFAYLSPVPMERLWRKARAEMRPGTLFISSTFSVPEQSPHETIQVDDLHHSELLIWRM